MISYLSSCVSPRRHLSAEQYEGKTLISKQQIKHNKAFSDYELTEYYETPGNRYILFPRFKPYLRAYLKGEKHYDRASLVNERKLQDSLYSHSIKETNEIEDEKERTKRRNKLIKKRNKKISKLSTKIKSGNWLMRTVGEPPVFYDSLSIAETNRQLSLFYASKGYFGAQVQTELKEHKRTTEINYILKEGTPHTFHKTRFNIPNPDLKKIIRSNSKGSFIIQDQPYEVSAISKERNRINTLLRDNGYYKFQRQYVNFQIDTVSKKGKAIVTILVETPSSFDSLPYLVRNIYFYIDKNTKGPVDSIIDNDTKYYFPKGYNLSTRVLNFHNKLSPYTYYNYTNTLQTQNLLSSLNTFKFINIHYRDVSNDTINQLDAIIKTSSYSKYAITTEAGVNVNVNQVQRLPGPFFNLRFKNRRVFKGFEIFETNVRYAIQGQVSFTSPDQIFPSQEIGINTGLRLPFFLFQKLLFGQKYEQRFSRFNPKSKINLGLSNVQRIEYTRTNLNLLLSYTWNNKKIQQHALAPVNINLIDTRKVTAEFDNFLNSLVKSNGVNVKQSFTPSYISSVYYDFLYNTNAIGDNKRSKYFRLFTESGGTSVTAHNLLAGKTMKHEVFGLSFYQYVKINTDLRMFRPVGRNGTLAWRLNTGIARGYGYWGTLPYEKFFFAGGINSIRAWSPRRLGPGSYRQTDEDDNLSYRFEQPGELLLESSLELRGQLFSILHGAIFLDAGNVWTINESTDRPGAQIQARTFAKEIALGTGVGLRFDFSFVIFRMDLGVKVWDPATQRIVPFSDPNHRVLNIGLGYPF